jgi:large subunit ribosomal protein L32
MPNPKRRHSRSRRDKRRANWKLTAANTATCPQCKGPIIPHNVCKTCGFYKGEIVLIVKEKKSKKKSAEESQEKQEKK